MKAIIILTFAATLFLFSGCMAVSILSHGGSHGDNSSSSSKSSTTVQKEITSNGIKAEATFPPLALNNATTFTLKITDAKTGKPLPNFDVWFHASYTHKPTGHYRNMMSDSSHQSMNHDNGITDDSSEHSKMENQHGINYDRQLVDSTGLGTFTVLYTPVQGGEYVIAFHLLQGRKKLMEDIVIEQKVTAGEAHESHSSGGMMGSLDEYAIGVGATMAARMFFSWTSGSMMF